MLRRFWAVLVFAFITLIMLLPGGKSWADLDNPDYDIDGFEYNHRPVPLKGLVCREIKTTRPGPTDVQISIEHYYFTKMGNLIRIREIDTQVVSPQPVVEDHMEDYELSNNNDFIFTPAIGQKLSVVLDPDTNELTVTKYFEPQ